MNEFDEPSPFVVEIPREVNERRLALHDGRFRLCLEVASFLWVLDQRRCHGHNVGTASQCFEKGEIALAKPELPQDRTLVGAAVVDLLLAVDADGDVF